jgi:hypothetical protein
LPWMKHGHIGTKWSWNGNQANCDTCLPHVPRSSNRIRDNSRQCWSWHTTIRALLFVTHSHRDRWWVHVQYYTNFLEHHVRQRFVGHGHGYWLLRLSCCMTAPSIIWCGSSSTCCSARTESCWIILHTLQTWVPVIMTSFQRWSNPCGDKYSHCGEIHAFAHSLRQLSRTCVDSGLQHLPEVRQHGGTVL